MSVAENVGLDVDQLRQDMKDPTINEILAENMEVARDLGIDGTPAIIVDDTIVPGAIGKDRLLELISAARS